MYKEIKSEYIKKKIKQTKWKDRDYIHRLKQIERLATGGRLGLMTGHAMNNLPDMYPEEWKAIWMELNPKGYKAELKRQKEEAEEEKKEQMTFEQAEKARKKQERDEWLEMGGQE